MSSRKKQGHGWIPSTTTGKLTMLPGLVFACLLMGVFLHSYISGKAIPAVFGDLMVLVLGLMGINTARNAAKDLRGGAPPMPGEELPPEEPKRDAFGNLIKD